MEVSTFVPKISFGNARSPGQLHCTAGAGIPSSIFHETRAPGGLEFARIVGRHALEPLESLLPPSECHLLRPDAFRLPSRKDTITSSRTIRPNWDRPILALVNAEHPPVRLPLGRDTVAVIEKKNAFVARELAELRSPPISTRSDLRSLARIAFSAFCGIDSDGRARRIYILKGWIPGAPCSDVFRVVHSRMLKRRRPILVLRVVMGGPMS
jgi:hypothetical protein